MYQRHSSPTDRHWPFWRVLLFVGLIIVAYYFIATPGPSAVYGFLVLLMILANVVPAFVLGDAPKKLTPPFDKWFSED